MGWIIFLEIEYNNKQSIFSYHFSKLEKIGPVI